MRQLKLFKTASLHTLGTLLLLAAACKKDKQAVRYSYLSAWQTPLVSQFSVTKTNF